MTSPLVVVSPHALSSVAILIVPFFIHVKISTNLSKKREREWGRRASITMEDAIDIYGSRHESWSKDIQR